MFGASLAIFSWSLGLLSTPILFVLNRLLFGPNLEPHFSNGPECVVDTKFKLDAPGSVTWIRTRYFRVEVVNTKPNLARNCRAYLSKIEKLDNGVFKSVAYYDTMPLNWSYREDKEAVSGIDI